MQGLPSATASRRQTCFYVFKVVSTHGEECPVPALSSVTIRCRDSLKPSQIELSNPPFEWKFRGPLKPLDLELTIGFCDFADPDKQTHTLNYFMENLSRDQYLGKIEDFKVLSFKFQAILAFPLRTHITKSAKRTKRSPTIIDWLDAIHFRVMQGITG